MELTFYGGAKSVTGANYLLEDKGVKILVDCGLFQGSKYAEELNYSDFPYDPAEINFVFITHSHADHVGRLPKLYKNGFRGKVLTTKATIDLIKKALPDNLNLIKEEARKDGHEPLFNLEDLGGVLSLAYGLDYEEKFDLGEGISAKLLDAGHILGSAIVEIDYLMSTPPSHKATADAQFYNSSQKFGNKIGKIYFSGDLGNPPTPLLKPTQFVNNADYIVIESAYGSRVHEDRAQRKDILIKVVKDTIERGGTLMIPSFAIERTQELLYEFNDLIENKIIPEVPIYVDSPLANTMTEVYKKYSDYFNKEVNYIIDSGDDIFNFPGLKLAHTTEESKAINNIVGPKIIIAGSGMSNGGRILHHESRYLPDPNSTILFIGYQVEGSPGRKILDGNKEVNIFGQKVLVNCRVEAIGGYSAHADQNMLLKWVEKAAAGGKLKKVFIVQGEEEAADALGQKVKNELKIEAIIPNEGERFEL